MKPRSPKTQNATARNADALGVPQLNRSRGQETALS